MKVAVMVWEDSVSTVCDFCSCLLIFDIEASEAKNPIPLTFETQMWSARVKRLKDLGVGVLLCGALSRSLERLLSTAGIEVIAWLCGSVQEVMKAYLNDSLSDIRFALPGCILVGKGIRGHRRRRFAIRPNPHRGVQCHCTVKRVVDCKDVNRGWEK